jgi:hypothetical protein
LRIQLISRLCTSRFSRSHISRTAGRRIEKTHARLVIAKALFNELVGDGRIAIRDGATQLGNAWVSRLLGEVSRDSRYSARRGILRRITTEAA